LASSVSLHILANYYLAAYCGVRCFSNISVIVPIYIEKIEWLDFPIWVKFSIIDSTENKIYFIEKLPVISAISITDKSAFPLKLDLECELLSDNKNGCIKIELPFNIESMDGNSTLFVKQSSVLTNT